MKSLLRSMLLMLAAPAMAHVTVTPRQLPEGAYARLSFAVSHGCDGSATTRLVLRLPAAQILHAKPMPKPGWTLQIQRVALREAATLHGRALNDSVAEIVWSGGPLDDAHYDEFVVHGKLAGGRQPLRFEVLQECERGRTEWSGAPGSPHPAPVLTIEAPPAGRAGHH
jgi:uncharacterized protein YcnI